MLSDKNVQDFDLSPWVDFVEAVSLIVYPVITDITIEGLYKILRRDASSGKESKTNTGESRHCCKTSRCGSSRVARRHSSRLQIRSGDGAEWISMDSIQRPSRRPAAL